MIQKPVPNCQWLIPKQARQVVGFLGGFTDMISQFSQEKDKCFEARLFIKQNDRDENATIQFHFGSCSDEMIEDFQTKYDIGGFFISTMRGGYRFLLLPSVGFLPSGLMIIMRKRLFCPPFWSIAQQRM